MKAILHIRDNLTGAVAVYQDEHWYPDVSPYLWQEGNYACDCNRGDFFDQAIGAPKAEHPCGTERYQVEHVQVR